MINYNHRSFFASVFNDWGYVLDFSNAEFDSFTFNSVGVAIQSEYGLSKGKSLTKFLEEAEYELVLKLIHDLIEYAELKELPIIEEKKFKNAKKLLGQYKESVGFSMMVGAEVKDSFNDAYIEKQMKIMLEMVDKSPADAIGKAKELLESCFKHILDDSGIEYTSRESMEQLRKKTFVHLGIDVNERYSYQVNKDLKKLYNSLNQIVTSINSLRNQKGDGHGRGKGFEEISPLHASLAVNASLTIVHFTWDVYKSKIENV